MNREELVERVLEYGDAVITYRSANSGRWKFNVCTLDMSTPYIQNKVCKVSPTSDTVLFFCWDTNSFRLLKYENVKSVVPLSAIVKND